MFSQARQSQELDVCSRISVAVTHAAGARSRSAHCCRSGERGIIRPAMLSPFAIENPLGTPRGRGAWRGPRAAWRNHECQAALWPASCFVCHPESETPTTAHDRVELNPRPSARGRTSANRYHFMSHAQHLKMVFTSLLRHYPAHGGAPSDLVTYDLLQAGRMADRWCLSASQT
jgi:hypothetical protein